MSVWGGGGNVLWWGYVADPDSEGSENFGRYETEINVLYSYSSQDSDPKCDIDNLPVLVSNFRLNLWGKVSDSLWTVAAFLSFSSKYGSGAKNKSRSIVPPGGPPPPPPHHELCHLPTILRSVVTFYL